MDDLEKLRGCIYVKHSLEIRLQRCLKYNFSEYEKALEKNLGGVKEINGGLYIHR